MAGGLTLLSYAIHRQDPVFIVGQAAGLFIYSRNLWFIYRRRPESEPHHPSVSVGTESNS